MSDFFLDFRPATQRDPDRAASFLKFFPDFQVFRIDEAGFSLVLTRCDDEAIWSPYRSTDGRVLIAIAGQIAPENSEWEQAKHVPGSGGLACKIIYQKYCESGLRALEHFNGSYVIILYDAQSGNVFLVGDRCGMFPLFKRAASDLPPVFSSHPDLLALSAADASDYDTTSLGEFLVRGHVSYPFTYYRGVVGAEYASVHRIVLEGGVPRCLKPRRYFELEYRTDLSEHPLGTAERLAAAFRKAVARRVHPNFGVTAVGLSGGLDSRIILCACPNPSAVTAFSFFDERNPEYRSAEAIAEAKSVKLLPLKREFDHYGRSAETGVTISGGMSSFLNNHLLGFRQHFKKAGFQNIVTGLYCDYFFKGLMLNRRKSIFSRNELLAPFSMQWYLSVIPLRSSVQLKVDERLDAEFPPVLRQDGSDPALLAIERRRLFPLCYEPENSEVLVPQRVIGWNMPVIDNDVLDVYLTMSPGLKLDRSMYERVVRIICGPEICRIQDANTGAPVGASHLRQLCHRYQRIISKRLGRLRGPKLSTLGSWPNWEFYLHNSKIIRDLWMRPNPHARDLLTELTGHDPFSVPIANYRGDARVLFERLLTLKIWLDLRKN
jgi:hypothetical protein